MLSILLLMLDAPEEMEEFEKFYYKYKNRMFNYVKLKLENNADAEEAANDAWFCIARNFSRFDHNNEQSAVSYIRKAANGCCVDIIRRMNRMPQFTGIDELYNYIASDYDVAKEIENKETDERIMNIIKSFPPIYVDIAICLYVHGLSAIDIADTLHMPYNSVKTKIRRIRKRLRKKIKEQKNEF